MDMCSDENMFERLAERIAILREQYQHRGGLRFSIPYELREELIEAVRQQQRQGVSMQRLALRLRVSPMTLSRLCHKEAPRRDLSEPAPPLTMPALPSAPPLRPVQVVMPPICSPTDDSLRTEPALFVRTPYGYELHGLSVEQAAALLRSLG